MRAGIDRQAALSRVGGDTQLLREIAVLFLEEYPRLMVDLRDAIARGDSHRLERTAHGLKGSVATFGAQAAVEAALRLEVMGRAQQMVEVSPVLVTLELALAALRPQLEAL